MPSQLKAEFDELSQEAAWLHMKWSEYNTLYGTKHGSNS